jgi:hypothetical protein
MSAAVAHAPDIRPIRSLVRTTRLALRSGTGLVGLGLTAGVAATALLVAVAADLLYPLIGPWVRATGLAIVCVATVIVFVWKGLAPFARRLRDAEIARRIEGRIPGMHNRLVSCLDLAGRTDEVSPAFYRKLVAESLNRIGDYRPSSVVDWRSVRKSLAFAAVALVALAGTGLALGERFTTAVARVFHPDADIPPVGRVTFAVEPGTTRVLSGEDITFSAVVTRGEPAGLTVELVGDGATVRHPLELTGDAVWQRTLRGLSAEKAFAKGFTYRIIGGGTWSREQHIEWAERPAVADVRVRVQYPAYLGVVEPRVNPRGDRDATGPTGSTVEVAVETEGEVVEAELQCYEVRTKPLPHRSLLNLALPPGIALPEGVGEHESVLVATHVLRPSEGRAWGGSFPLIGTGTYRVALRNSVGHGNRPANTDPRYVAVPDGPPTVFIERPGTDLVLSKPERAPLQVTGRDDYGLRDLWLAVQRDGEAGFTRTVRLKEYPDTNPPTSDEVVAPLDLTATGLDVKPGQSLRYRVEVRDRRPNSDPTVSPVFSVRIAADPNSADKLLESFEKGQDAVREKLNNLVAEQQKIKERIDAARSKPPESIRQELADLAARERANAAAAVRLEQELKALADKARQTPLVNGTIAKEMQRLGDGFKSAATDPLDDLAAKLKQEAAGETPPDLKDLQQRGARVQKNLEALKGRMDAVADAHKGMKTDPEKALTQLRDALLQEQGRSTAKSLEELKDILKALREDLANLQGKQENLADQTAKAKDPELPEIEKKQFSLDDLLKMDLEQAKKILDRERTRRMEKRDLPSDPFQPALGGAQPKADAKGPNAAARKGGPPPGRREALQDHQKDNLKDLDAAQKALASDEKTLEEMIQSLMNATQQTSKNPPKDGPPPKDSLSQLLGSEPMKNAIQMAERAKQAKPGSPDQPLPPGATAGSGATTNGPGSLDDLDPATRATILQLPPRVREELLQGMKAQGPEGYRKFIQDYFKRLSEAPR